MEAINRNGVIRRNNPIKWVEVTKIRTADIEDIFDPTFYMKLVNEAYFGELRTPVTLKAISESEPRIVHRLETYFEGEDSIECSFDSYRPASHLLEKHALLRNEIDDETIERAASMFERINALLSTRGVYTETTNGSSVRTAASTR